MAIHGGAGPRTGWAAGLSLLALLAAGCGHHSDEEPQDPGNGETEVPEVVYPQCSTGTQEEVGACVLEYASCEHAPGRWTSTARDVSEPSSGLHAGSGVLTDRDPAEAEAAVKLFRSLDGCNCEEEEIPYGRCILVARGCFLFESAEAFEQQVPTYWMRVTERGTGKTGSSGTFAQPQDAFNPALADLGTKMNLDACTN